jgi:hypothetical protein
MTEEQQIAATIIEQLGGRKFIAMTGSKNFMTSKDDEGNNGLLMQLTRNQSGASYLRITLNSMDLYKMEFIKSRGMNLTTVKEFDGVYDDMLQKIFTEVTGLYTHL